MELKQFSRALFLAILLSFCTLSESSSSFLDRLEVDGVSDVDNPIAKLMKNPVFQRAFLPPYMERICANNDNLFAGVGPQCTKDIKNFLYQVCKLFDNTTSAWPELWALHMIDAWAKPPEGILSGHINPMGDYDECVGISQKNIVINQTGETSSFEGLYCTVYLLPIFNESAGASDSSLADSSRRLQREAVHPDELIHLISILEGVIVLPSIGTCFPNTCTTTDIAALMPNLFRNLNALLYALLNGTVVINPAIDRCYEKKKPDFDAGDIAVMSLIGTLAFLAVFAAIVDVWLHRGVEKPKPQSLPMQYLMAFSIYTNTIKWLSTRGSGDDLGCLHGIRFFSTTWVILAHTWYMVTFLPVWNMVDLKKVHEDWAILTVLNSTISVDTFFLLSGLLVAYNVMKVLDKQKGRLNIPMFYIHRYLRLTPTYAILIGIMATIVPYLGSGPFWKIMDRWSNICEHNWWTNLLYVNNFVNTSWLCQGEAWYLANDMQFYILSPIVLYPLWKWTTFGIILLMACTVGSILTPGLMVYFKETTPTSIGTRDIQEWFLDIYIKPWGRVQTYLVGVWLGYILYRYKGRKISIPKLIQLIFWILAIGTSLSVLYGMYPYFDPEQPIPRVEGLFYASLNRFGWACSVGWVIFACCKGYGGLINSFLSWKVFIPLGRLCFCVFLVSLHLQMILHLSFRQALTFANYSMVNFFFAHLVMSFLVGYFCTMLFESPFMKVEKLIFEGPDRGPRPAPGGGGGGGPTANGGPSATPEKKERYGMFYTNKDRILNGDPAKSQ